MNSRIIILLSSVGLALILSLGLLWLPLAVMANGSTIQTTYADFTQSCTALTGIIPSPLLTDTQVTGLSGGAVILAPTRIDPFDGSTLNATLWHTEGWIAAGSPYTPTLSSGILTLPGGSVGNGGAVYSTDTYTHGAVEAIVDFGSGVNQHIGFANHRFGGDRYFIFSTFNLEDDHLYARVNNSGSEDRIDLGLTPAGFHNYRVEWGPTSLVTDTIIFYIDGAEVSQFDVNNSDAVNFHAYLSNDGAADLQVDLAQVEPPYTASGTYTSCAFDAGVGNGWTTISRNVALFPQTSLTMEARVSANGSTWSAWESVSSGGLINSSAMARYAQYRLLLATLDTQLTPVIGSVTLNNDTVPGLSLEDVTVAENEASGLVTFTVALSPTSAYTATVNYTTAISTAIAPADYLTTAGMLTFPPGVTTQTVTVTIQNDSIDEFDEKFLLNLSNPVNAILDDSQAVGTITDDDSAPTVSINNVAVTEGISGTTVNANFTVSLSQASGKTITMNYDTANVSASAPTDYLTASGILTFTPGITTQQISAVVNGDGAIELDETFQLNLSALVNLNGSGNDTQGIGTINNDDAANVSITQSGGGTNVTEGGATDSYQVKLASQPLFTVTLTITSNVLQVNAAPISLNFTNLTWDTPQTITVTAVNDLIAEGLHTGVISHTAASSDINYDGLAINNVTANITDNDTAGISRAPATIAVTEGSITATYAISLTSEPTAPVTVTVTSNAQLGVTPGGLNFTSSNWTVPQIVTVIAVDDAASENSPHTGAITHTITSPDPKYNNISVAGVTANITDNDAEYLFLPFIIKQP